MKSEEKKHNGHLIELKPLDKKKAQLFIDSVNVPYGKFDDGLFYLNAYAYDPNKDLFELAMKYLDHKDKAKKITGNKKGEKGGKDHGL